MKFSPVPAQLIPIAAFAALLATSPAQALAADSVYSLDCKNIPYQECLDKLSKASGVTISAPAAVGAKPVWITVPKTSFMDALKRATDALENGSYAILEDKKAGSVSVTFHQLPDAKLQPMGVPGAPAGGPVAAAPANPTPANPTAVPAQQAKPQDPARPAPGAQVQQANRMGEGVADEDTPITEGGPTPRQLSAMHEQNQLATPDLDAPIGVTDMNGDPVTLRKIMEVQQTQGPLPKVVVPPDANITPEELERQIKQNAPKPADLEYVVESASANGPTISFQQLKKLSEDGQKALKDAQKLPPEKVLPPDSFKDQK